MAVTGFTRKAMRFGLANAQAAKEIGDILDYIDGVGNRWHVDSGAGADTNDGKAPDRAFATLDYAIGKATANNGDVIYVLPGHAETITADSGVDIDVAGLSIIGLGHGSARPTFTFTTSVAADFKLAAANTVVKNILFVGGIDATTGVVEISAADCALINTEYRDSTGQATDVIITTADADRLVIDGHVHNGAAADGPDTAIVVVGCDDVTIKNSVFYGNFDLGAIQCRTTAAVRLRVHDIQVWTEGAEDLAILDTVTGSTGIMGPNIFMILKDDAGNVTEAITGATFYVMDHGVHVNNAANQRSLAINWTQVADS